MNSIVKQNNRIFVLFNTLLVLIVLAACVYQYYCPSLMPPLNTNTGGIACQVITAIVCCVASMIGISFSIQDSSFFGIQIKELRELRVGYNYSLLAIMVISVLAVVLNLITCVCDLFYISYGISFSAVLFCLYVIWKEVPLMAKKEKAALAILKSRIATDIDNDDIRTTEYDKAIKYLICTKNLKTAYEKLNLGKDHSVENKTLLLKLLDLQIDITSQLDAVDNKQERRESVDALRENLSDIVSFSFDIMEILGPDFNYYLYYITRTLFILNEIPDGKDACARVIRRAMMSLDYSNRTLEKPIMKDFLYAILISLFTYSVSSGDIDFLDVAREYHSDKTYSLSKNYNSTLLFSLVSMYLYYICEIEASVPVQIKETIRNSICSNNNIKDKSVIYSWANLYHMFSSNASVQYGEFMRVFMNNEHSFDYMLLNAGAHWVTMDESFAFRWYVVNLLNRSSHPVDDYSVVFGKELDNGTTHQLKRLYDDCYKDGNVFSEPDFMKKMLSFYNTANNNELSLFLIVEQNRHTLFNYLTTIKSRVIIDEAHKLENNNDQTLVTKIKTKVMSSLNKEWGLNKALEMRSDKKSFSICVEKSDAINFEDVLTDYFKQAIFSLIRNEIHTKKILKDELFEENIDKILAMNPIAASSECSFVWLYITDPLLQEKCRDKIASLKMIHSSILPFTAIILEGGFAFNCVIDKLTIKKAPEDVINEKVEQYKRADGQYVYESTFMNRDDVYSVVKSKAIVITCSIRFNVVSDEDSIVEIELFSTGDSAKD